MTGIEVEDYMLLDLIGVGSFSQVYKAIDKRTGHVVAVKMISNSKQAPQETEKEIEIMSKIVHPLVVNILDVIWQADKVYLIMEYFDGLSLLEVVNLHGSLTEEAARNIFGQVFLVIKYLHDHNIIHRDLKAENILVNSRNEIKLIDFGFSRSYENQDDLFFTFCGSPAYCPPEMLSGGIYSTSCDIWSLGIVLYAMVIGKLPYHSDNFQQISDMILNHEPDFSAPVSPQLSDIIRKMLNKDPNERIYIDGIKNHPWMSSFFVSKTYQTIKSLFKHKVVNNNNLDNEILGKLRTYGCAVTTIINDLEKGALNNGTALYKLERLDKLNRKLHRKLHACQSDFHALNKGYSSSRVEIPILDNDHDMYNPITTRLPVLHVKLPTHRSGELEQHPIIPLTEQLHSKTNAFFNTSLSGPKVRTRQRNTSGIVTGRALPRSPLAKH